MQKSLLSHIASNFIAEYENVANSSIAYLLNKYPTARSALSQLIGCSVPDYFITEHATQSNGRFDVAGLDGNGNVNMVIEGKFWASLTDNQPIGYLNELDNHGVLLFLTPDRRLASLKAEISSRLNNQYDQRIQLSSWQNFLYYVEVENNKSYDENLASDLIQIKSLCLKMDTEGMPPISASDLDTNHARICSQFSDLISECNALLRKWEYADFKGLKTTSFQYGHGFYFKAFNFGCFLNFSTHDWFTKESHTPFWLSIQNLNWEKDYKLHHFLTQYDECNTYDEDNASLYALTLETGMDKNATINHIVSKTKKVLIFLNDNLA